MSVTDVNSLVNRFEQAAKMMKTGAKGGVPNIPGMGPMPGGLSRGKKKPKKKAGSRSGNPAKRAQEALEKPSGPAAPGSSFGVIPPQ
jgi:signal recognition particle subunit SRP54